MYSNRGLQLSIKLWSMSQYQMTSELVVENYRKLSSADAEERQRANVFLMSLPDHEQTWGLSQDMIKLSPDPNFVFLGAQLLYQKIQRQLHNLSVEFQLQLKEFLFGQLDSGRITHNFIIDKLASSAALISCLLFLEHWISLVGDLTEFMKKSNNHLKSGLMVLERIPEELRMTNRISQGAKNKIQSQFLQQEFSLAEIFNSVFDLQDEACSQCSLKAMESWIRIGFPLMKYPQILKKVLSTALESFERLEMSMKVVCEGLKVNSEQKCLTVSEIDPLKERQIYDQQEIGSLQLVITFITENKGNFLNFAKIELEYVEIYLSAVQQLASSYSFLILEQVGFDILSIILEVTNSGDFKLSYRTFEFWIEYSEKMSRLSLGPQLKEKIWFLFCSLFELLLEKIAIRNPELMCQADLKEEETVDEADGMTFTQYRKESADLLKFIYDFFVKAKKDEGALFYFSKVEELLKSDGAGFSAKSELAVFLVKSPLESMITPFETSQITKALEFVVCKVNGYNPTANGGARIPEMVLGETMNLIRDCTREIKEKEQLLVEALKLVLGFINDEKLCHHAAYCFQVLMETVHTLSDPLVAEHLIHFYQQSTFRRQVVLEKILEGIFSAVSKVPDPAKVEAYLDAILATLLSKYQHCSRALSADTDHRSDLFLSLVEIKTVLDAYEGSAGGFKQLHRAKFLELANRSVQIVNAVLPLGLEQRLKLSSLNEVGQSISIFRVSLKIIEVPHNFPQPLFLDTLDCMLTVLNAKDVEDYSYLLTILTETLIQFTNCSCQHLDAWLVSHLDGLCHFFLDYAQNLVKADPDVMKMFFCVQEALILYNRDVFHHYPKKDSVLQVALHCLQHMNERNLQRKILTFLVLGLDNQVLSPEAYERIISSVFASVPVVHLICYVSMAKIIKVVLKGSSLQQKEKLFSALINQAPYQEFDARIKEFLVKAISLAVEMGEDRNIKAMFGFLTELVWKRTGSDILMQLELKVATWKRDLKKLQSN